MSWLLWSSLAFATQPAVLGVGEARSVVLVLAPTLEERSTRCDDLDGDGVWTCPAGALPAELEALGVLVDGQRLSQLTDVTLGESPAAVVIERQGEALRVSTSPLAPREGGGGARPGAAVLMVEVRTGDASAPRLAVQSARGSDELACQDDGRFPDPVANDGVRTCAGLVEDGAVTLTLRLPGQAPQALGELSWPPEVGLRQVRIDERGAAVSSWPILDRAAAQAPRREDAPRVQGPPQGAPGGSGAPGAPQQPGGQMQVTPQTGPDRLQLTLAGVLALTLFGVGWRIGRARPGPIPHARALPPPPALPGAPAGSVIFRVPADQISSAMAWLAGRLSATRPVLVVETDPRTLGAIQTGGAVLAATSPDVDDVLEAATAVARRAIAAPALLVRSGTLSWAGGLGNTPEATLLAGLPSGVILVIVQGAEPAPVALPEVTLTPHEGQWRAR